MRTGLPNRDDVAMALGCHGVLLNSSEMRQLLATFIEHMQRLDATPTHIAVAKPLEGKGVRSYARMKKKLAEMEWASTMGFSLRFLRSGLTLDAAGFLGASVEAMAGTEGHCRNDPEHHDQRYVGYEIYPADLEISEEAAERRLLDFARTFCPSYGYVLHMLRRFGALPYLVGLGVYNSDRAVFDDEANNRGAWTMRPAHWPHYLLRDVYPINLLTAPYLQQPVEGTTLEKWIPADEGRGRLEPLNERVMIWRPVPETIPALRERLFRAGRLFYWQFFDPVRKWYRDFNQPWKEPDEVPEIYRAEFCKGQDPRLIF